MTALIPRFRLAAQGDFAWSLPLAFAALAILLGPTALQAKMEKGMAIDKPSDRVRNWVYARKGAFRGPDFGRPTMRPSVPKGTRFVNGGKAAQGNGPIGGGHSQSALRHGFGAMIYLFQRLFSPQDGETCPRRPVCSVYGARAIRRHGGLWGTIMAVDRIMRCHPWQHPLELQDPVPARVFSPRRP
jgi:putative membrane protein insertion efficiency factor